MAAAISITNLTKTYATGQHALKGVSLEIRPGEIFALLGPNGAGKTTLISIVCGIVRATSGTVLVEGHDIQRDFRAARERIGLVPQELAIEAFETVRAAAAFSRGLFGRAPDPACVERVLRDLSLWDRRDDILMTLSGGMKRRVMIAKALAHEPRILFLDEPTAGVDVELRRDLWDLVRRLRDLSLWDRRDDILMTLSGGMKRRVMIAKALAHEPRVLFLDEPTAGVDVELRRDMWALVRRMRDSGVTIILTTHYIDEAEEMADRIGVINHGELVVVEDKARLMKQLGKRQLTLTLQEPLAALPAGLGEWPLALVADGHELQFTFDAAVEQTGVAALLRRLDELGINYRDLNTRESSLEEIFVSLVGRKAGA